MIDKYDIFSLTPIQEYNGIYFKRDDLYMPFKDIPLSGGKVRQAINLVQNNEKFIREKCNSTIATATSVHSPQGIILTRVANEFGFKTLLVLGATKQSCLDKNILMKNCLTLGAEFDTVCGVGYDTALMSRIRLLNRVRDFFVVKFGINSNEVIDIISEQVKNLPNDLHNLVIPVGSAITLSGILKGLLKYKKNIKRIIACQIAGYDRTDIVNQILGSNAIEYEFHIDKTFAYSKQVIVKFNDTEFLDKIYEAKAYKWMMNNVDIVNEKTLFWIVGNSSFVRENF